jgi:hypothetical protein
MVLTARATAGATARLVELHLPKISRTHLASSDLGCRDRRHGRHRGRHRDGGNLLMATRVLLATQLILQARKKAANLCKD